MRNSMIPKDHTEEISQMRAYKSSSDPKELIKDWDKEARIRLMNQKNRHTIAVLKDLQEEIWDIRDLENGDVSFGLEKAYQELDKKIIELEKELS